MSYFLCVFFLLRFIEGKFIPKGVYWDILAFDYITLGFKFTKIPEFHNFSILFKCVGFKLTIVSIKDVF